jgi:hypothetical protein
VSDNLLDQVEFPSWEDPATGERCMTLPGGHVFRKTEEDLAEFMLATYSEPNPNERAIVIIERLTTPEERELFFSMVHDLARAVAQ